MRCYHPHTFRLLGFEEVLAEVRSLTRGEVARGKWNEVQPLSDPEALLPALQLTHEYKEMLVSGVSVPAWEAISVGEMLQKIRFEGSWIPVQDLFDLAGWVRGVTSLREFFREKEAQFPALAHLLLEAPFPDRLYASIDRVIDERGKIRDDASEALKQLREEIHRCSKSLRNVLNKLLRKAKEENWNQGEEVTIRNQRLVLPLKAEARGRIPGFIHDISQSGNTIFLEPAESLNLNNQLKELQLKEQNEIIRILTLMSDKLREVYPDLLEANRRMIDLDLIQAKASFANKFQCIFPQLAPEGEMLEIREARYPPLLLKAEKEPLEVIPLSVTLTHKNRIMVVSGPNAGGKSVALKTVGLLQIMLQCGMLIPVEEGSVFRLFDALFMDIGDEQSVANDLSTYTSHLFYLRQMGDNMDQRSLFLIDEFGSGTDPKQGGAIAEAFLARFARQGAYGIITTHYGNIKEFSAATPGLINAAMEFDTQAMAPTYRLNPGLPGRSYAFEIAQRVGVHPTILKKARAKVGSQDIEADQLIKDLEKKQSKLNRLLEENESQEKQLQEMMEKYHSLKEELQGKRQQLIREAKAEANTLIEKANKDIERTIREIREHQAEKEKTKALRQELAAQKHEEDPKPVKKPSKKTSQPTVKVLEGPIEVGDWVKLKMGETTGEIQDILGNKAILAAGEVKLTVKLNQLQKVPPPKARKQKVSVRRSMDLVHARTEVNVLGKRVEEALPLVDDALDKALLSGLKKLRILHGKGSGILREVIRDHLAGLSFVKKYYDAHVEEGGDGWTVCELE